MMCLKPTWLIEDLTQISLEDLKQANIEQILIDLDNTLILAHNNEPDLAMLTWIESMVASGIIVTVVSNNVTTHVAEHVKPFRLQFVANAKKPFPIGMKRALEMSGIDKAQTIVIGDQLLTDVLGGNWIGVRTMMIKPRSDRDKWYTLFSRFVERQILKLMMKRYGTVWQNDLSCNK